MKLPLSILTTVAIALIVWLIMLLQPEDSWVDEHTDYKSLLTAQNSERKSAGAQTIDATDNPQKQQTPTTKKASDAVNNSPHEVTMLASAIEITGISRTISLTDVDMLWQEFTKIGHLERAINSTNFDVYAVYSMFNTSYNEAKVMIGYDMNAMNDSVIATARLPMGKRSSLLAAGKYNATELMNAWQNIDYRRGLVAVIEKHHFVGDVETISLSAIYEEQ